MHDKFDIKERTYTFGVRVTRLVRRFPKDTAGFVLGKQVIRSGTSVGSHIEEADDSLSTKDFIYKLRVARREAKETFYWLKHIRDVELLEGPKDITELKLLVQESKELKNIISSIINNTIRSGKSKDETK